MTDTVLHPTVVSGAASRPLRLAAQVGNAFHRAMLAAVTRHALDGLSDNMLTDIGLARCDIPFVAEAIAHGRSDPTRDALDRLNRTVAQRGMRR